MSTINGVNNNNYAYQTQAYTKVQEKSAEKEQYENYAELEDVLELSSNAEKTDSQNQIYSRDTAVIDQLKALTQSNMDTLRSMVQKLLSSQSYTASGQFNASFEAMGSLLADNEAYAEFNFKLDLSLSYEFTSKSTGFDFSSEAGKEVQAQAQELISEDGELGVKQVSENILSFAKAISGGDTSKIEMLRNACQKGYDQVAALFGGADKMPEVSQKTYEAVMKGFDDWSAEATGETKS